MASVGQIAKAGWKADSIKAGNKITVEIHPLKNGSRGGQYVSAKLADGHVLDYRGDPDVARENTIH